MHPQASIASPPRRPAPGHAGDPAEVVVEAALGLELVDAGQAGEPRTGQVLDGQPDPAVGIGELADAGLDRPGRCRGRHALVELGEVDPVVADVRPGTLGERHLAAGHGGLDELGDGPDAQVGIVAPDVEGLVVDGLAVDLEHRDERVGDVADVDQWPPLAAVALEPDLPGRVRPAGQVVDDDVAAQARRDAERGGVAQVRRARSRDRRARGWPAPRGSWIRPYGVTGLNAARSSTGRSPAAPYRLHEEENRNRGTPGRSWRPARAAPTRAR